MSIASLAPFPEGWYCLGLSAELPAGSARPVRICGEDRVLFRTASGRPGVLDAFCPHLGAHLGHGSRVEGEQLRCPMHGFCFDGQGTCVSTPYGSRPPPAARARAWPVIERHGLLLTWSGPPDVAPRWEPPALDDQGWRPLRMRCLPLKTHVQEIAENSVDLGHFPEVHHYWDVEELAPAEVEGPILRARYAFSRANPFLASLPGIRTEISVQVIGFGLSVVDAHVRDLDVRARLFVLPMPVDVGQSELRVAATLPVAPQPILPLRLLPTALLHDIIFRGYVDDVLQDRHIWENKRWVSPPALAQGDGPIGRYRSWARQFYKPTSDGSSMSSAATTT